MSEALFEEQTVPAFELDHVPVQVKLIYLLAIIILLYQPAGLCTYTVGADYSVLIREVSLIQELLSTCAQMCRKVSSL